MDDTSGLSLEGCLGFSRIAANTSGIIIEGEATDGQEVLEKALTGHAVLRKRTCVVMLTCPILDPTWAGPLT